MAQFILSAFADEAGTTLAEQIAALKRNGIDYIEPRNINGKPILTLTDDELKLIHKNGFECRAWGISNTEIMAHTVEMGVDAGMTVNFPDKLVEYLKNKETDYGTQHIKTSRRL